MKISLLEPIGVSRETIDALAAPLIERGHEFVCYDAKTTDIEELKRRSADSDIVMIANNPYPNEVVRAAEKLKVLDVAFTGIDHVGLEACRERSVTVLNAANYSNQTVAELAVGMAIDLLRHVIPADRAVREGKTSAGLMGREIGGRTVGVVGTGRIGMIAAKLFQAFGAKVIAASRTRRLRGSAGLSGRYAVTALVAGPGALPHTAMVPAVGTRRPAASLSSVVLPEPLGPSRPSSVVTLCPSARAASTEQDSTGLSSRKTVHKPQLEVSQPRLTLLQP